MNRQLAFAFVVLIAFGGAARAGEPEGSTARQHTDAGTAEYNLGHYAEAARQYEEAYKLTRDPVLLFNIGQSYRLAGQVQSALTAYRSYLRTASPEGQKRAQVQRRIDELEKLAAQNPTPSTAVAPVPALTTVPPAAAPAPSTPPPVVAPPAATNPVQPAVLVSSQAPEASAPPVSRPFYTRTWFWAGVGVLVAGGVLAAILVGRGGTEANIGGDMDPKLVVLR